LRASAATAELKKWAESLGAAIAWGSVSVLEDVLSDIDRRRSRGEFDPGFYHTRLARLCRMAWIRPPGSKTVIMMAVPRPAHQVVFTLEDGPLETILPPTYVAYDQLPARLLNELLDILPGETPRVMLLRTPLKAVAASLDLVKYGLNNITYVPGLGSYHQLVGFVTDVDLCGARVVPRDGPELMPECQDCGLCRDACPTGAIPEGRFMLRAERCLTFYGEAPGPWPSWLLPSAHHCLIGCLKCQQVCPQNRDLLSFEPAEVSFDARETSAILEEGSERVGPVWDTIREKLEILNVADSESVIGRNLRALLETSRVSAERANGRMGE
jgi:epoxyqueuosine reductase